MYMVCVYSTSSTPGINMRECERICHDRIHTIEDPIEVVTDVERVLEECVGHVSEGPAVSSESSDP